MYICENVVLTIIGILGKFLNFAFPKPFINYLKLNLSSLRIRSSQIQKKTFECKLEDFGTNSNEI